MHSNMDLPHAALAALRKDALSLMRHSLDQCRHLMFYHARVTMHVRDPQLFIIKIGHRVMLAGLCLSLYTLEAVINVVDMIFSPI